MWSLGYTQIRDQSEIKAIEDSVPASVITNSTEATTTTATSRESTTSDSTTTPSSIYEQKSLENQEQEKPKGNEINTDFISSTNLECSSALKENSEPTAIGALEKENVNGSLSKKRNSLSSASGSDSETVNLNVDEQDEIREKSVEDKEAQILNNTDEFENEFVLIDPNQFPSLANKKSDAENESILKPGYKWQRELIFRSKLTMHTSFDRKDNSDPASVTALSISKDNKTIYVGDSRGRVYTWVCTENPGKTRADHWVRDEVVEMCKNKKCNVKFTLNVRKHHCRDCGGIFCNNCTKYETTIPRLQIKTPVRVCIECYNNIKAEEALLPPINTLTS